MRRVVLVLAAMALALLLASGVALAVTKVGTPRDDTISGTNGPDQIDGRAGDDDIFSRGGRDTLYGGKGDDRLVGGPRIGILRSSGDKVMSGALATTPCLAAWAPTSWRAVRATTFFTTVNPSGNSNGTCWEAAPVTTRSAPSTVRPRATSLVVALAGIARKSTART